MIAAESFEQFVVVVGPRLHRLAFLLTGNNATAEDLVQDALTKVGVRWPRLKDHAPEAYARTVMVNSRRSWHRRRARVREHLTDRPPESAIVDGAERQVDDRLWLQGALASLPPRQRLIVILRYYQDLSIEEVAQELGCGVGTVKSQASRGLAALRKNFPNDVTIEMSAEGERS